MEQEHVEEPNHEIRMIERTFVRCDWCGIPVSEEWIDTPEGEHYCSGTCMMAEFSFQGVLCMGTLILPFMSVFLFIFNNLITTILGLFLILAMPFTFVVSKLESRKERRECPKNSRKYEIITVSQNATVVKCPSCDEHHELSFLAADKILTCEYCSTTSVVFVDDKIVT